MKIIKEFKSYDSFKKWFGDSKVVHDGKPIVLYHGSDNEFNVFNINKYSSNTGNDGHYGKGFYFTKDINEAKTYGTVIYECYLKIENPFLGTDDDYLLLNKKGWNVGDYDKISIKIDSFKKSLENSKEIFKLFFDKFLSSKDMIKTWDYIVKYRNYDGFDSLNEFSEIISWLDINNSDDINIPNYIDDILDVFNISLNKDDYNYGFTYKCPLHYITDVGNYGASLTRDLISLGYDGVIYNGEYVVFEPNQIKSIHNNGTWSITSNNIYE